MVRDRSAARTFAAGFVGAAGLALLSLASGCASNNVDRRSVLLIDGCGGEPLAEPLNLDMEARAAGCAYSAMNSWFEVELTVTAVISPSEFVIRGRYGPERVHPWLEAATIDAVQKAGARSDELRTRLEAALVGRRLVEPHGISVSGRSSDGLRIVSMFRIGGEPVDDLVRSIAQVLRVTSGVGGPAAADTIDLSVVKRHASEFDARVADMVAAAERWSPFRAPAGLLVEWKTHEQMPESGSSVYDEWWRLVGTCFSEDEGPSTLDGDETWQGRSIPGGRIYLQKDRDWRQAELRFVLLHELMHQHQFALCAAGKVALKDVPGWLCEAHASSWAHEILRRQGANAATLEFAREWDPYAGGVGRFDALRADLGLSPDECLQYLESHPEVRRRLIRTTLITPFGDEDAIACSDGDLAFEFAGRSGNGCALVTIANRSDLPFAGYCDGWWHLITQTSNGMRSVGGTPFALRLPARGRVTLETAVTIPDDAEVVSCRAIFRETPAPVFER